MSYKSISGLLQFKINTYNTATRMYNNVTTAWQAVSYDRMKYNSTDDVAIVKMAEQAVTERLVHYYKQRAFLSGFVLEQAIEDEQLKVDSLNNMSNVEKIDLVESFINDLSKNTRIRVGG